MKPGIIENYKSPSELLSKAGREAREQLSELLAAIHAKWQSSEHYSLSSELTRLPNARFAAPNFFAPDGGFSLEWVGEGVDCLIEVHLSLKSPLYKIFGNQMYIDLLSLFLKVSGPEGLYDELSATALDKLDMRNRIEENGSRDSHINWSIVKLYEFLAQWNSRYAEIGLSARGFWKSRDADFELAKDASSSDVNSGTLGDYLREQPSGSIEHEFGLAYQALQNAMSINLTDARDWPFEKCPLADMELHFLATHYGPLLVCIGQTLERIEWRLRDERRLELARKFDSRARAKTKVANEARFADARKREKIVREVLEKIDLDAFRAKSSGRILIRPLARELASKTIFGGRVKSAIGVPQLEKILKRVLKSDFSSSLPG